MKLNSMEISGADLAALCRVIITKLGFNQQGPLTIKTLTDYLVKMKRLAVDEEIELLTTAALDTVSFVTLGTTTYLAGERVLTAGTGITITDGGAGSTVTVAFGPLSSLQLATALTDETGTGSAVFATSPSLTTATLNTYTTIAQGDAPSPTTDKLYNVGGNLLFNGINLTAGGALPVGTEGQMMYSNAGVWTAFSGMIWNDTSNYLTVDRMGLTTDAIASMIVCRATKTTDMGDGFGAGIAFWIKDNAGLDNDIGYIRFYRSGADNKGAFKITLNNAGYVDVILITPAGVVNIPNLTASNIVMTDASKNLVSVTDIPTATTIGSAYIYRVGGTDVAVADGGTGASTLTDHGILLGSGASAVTPMSVGTNGQLVKGVTGADPIWSTTVLTDGTNTFNLTNGTAVLDIAAGATLNIDKSLTVDGQATTITGAGQANTITLNESLTVGDGYSGTVTFSGASKTVTVADNTTLNGGTHSGTNTGDVTVSAPISLSGQAISLVNNAGSPATVTTIDTDGTLAGNSDIYIPTQKAVKTYADTKLAKSSNLSDVANTATSRTNLGLGAGDTPTHVNMILTGLTDGYYCYYVSDVSGLGHTGFRVTTEFAMKNSLGLSDPSSGSGMYITDNVINYTGAENVAETFYGKYIILRPIINAGHTNSGSLYGTYIDVRRNYNSTSEDDGGTLNSLYALRFAYGHDNNDGAEIPLTTNAFGIYLTPYYSTGKITNLYDIYIETPIIGGTAPDAHYSIYQAATIAKNYFGSPICIGTTTIESGSTNTLNIANGTAPDNHVDNQIIVYSVDSSDSAATLGLFLEQAVEDIGTFTASHKIKIKINGTEYWVQLDAV